MADELGFWAYRLDNAFPADMHNKLVTLMNESFVPTKGVCEATRRKKPNIPCKYDYKVLNMCKHPCACADMYHTIWQWGQGSNKSAAPDTVRPTPPAAVEEMVGMSSKHLVEEFLGHKLRGGVRGAASL